MDRNELEAQVSRELVKGQRQDRVNRIMAHVDTYAAELGKRVEELAEALNSVRYETIAGMIITGHRCGRPWCICRVKDLPNDKSKLGFQALKEKPTETKPAREDGMHSGDGL